METENPHPVPTIDRRGDARIVRSALDEVKAIQTLLADIYKDAGDGRTLVRELVQNADDARADRLLFVVVDQGWKDAENSLLHGPGLLVMNNGPFLAEDRDALHLALGGSKAEDIGKIGRFGIGLKSVFHICEAIVYVGAEDRVLRPGALNPWAGTSKESNTDPIHPDWDSVGEKDLDRLRSVGAELAGNFENGLLLWIPLRRSDHLDRATDRQYGLGDLCLKPEKVSEWFKHPASLALLLAQCDCLYEIEATWTVTPDRLAERLPLVRVTRSGDERSTWVGRYDDDSTVLNRSFEGVIESNARGDHGPSWKVLGIEQLGHEELRRYRSAPNWPVDQIWREGRSELVPRKALTHAAVTLLHSKTTLPEKTAIRLRWAVFLPLDDDATPQSGTLVETVEITSLRGSWDIVLHGYFWPSHDRRSIPGVTNHDNGSGPDTRRVLWNRGVRDKLLLPLLPAFLAQVTHELDERDARLFLRAVSQAKIITDHLEAVTQQEFLLPVITERGIRWANTAREGTQILSIRSWTEAPETVRKSFMASIRQDELVFIDEDAPRICGALERWSVDLLESLLDCVRAEIFHSMEGLKWIHGLLRHFVQPNAAQNDEILTTLAQWIGKRIGEGALEPATSNSDEKMREEFREIWKKLYAVFPETWIVHAPVASQYAVVELAAAGLVGKGFLLIPFGMKQEQDHSSKPESGLLDQVLLQLGQYIGKAEGTPKRIQKSRLSLAETLLVRREKGPLMTEELESLPLIRVHRLPDEKDEAWPASKLSQQIENWRIFRSSGMDAGPENGDGSPPETPSDPKQAVKDLAEAIGEPVWFVNTVCGVTADVPVPGAVALASAVLHSQAVRPDRSKPLPLLRRLEQRLGEPGIEEGDNLCNAARFLLTRRNTPDAMEDELYYVRSGDSEREKHGKTLELLLGLLNCPWRRIDSTLVEPLSQDFTERLRVRAIDTGVLYELLREALGVSEEWNRIGGDDALHLIRRLYGNEAEKKRLWYAMPLHRRVDGQRGPIDRQTFRLSGRLQPPSALAVDIHLLKPEVEVETLYYDVPKLDDEGILRAMLGNDHPWQFADEILAKLQPNGDGPVLLPRNDEIRDLLRQKKWLPDQNQEKGIAPCSILLLPEQMQARVSVLAKAGAIGGGHLPDDVRKEMWRRGEAVVREILGRLSRGRQVRDLARTLEPGRVAGIDTGAFLILPEAEQINIQLITEALETPLAGSHSGWDLLRAAVEALGGAKKVYEKPDVGDLLVDLAQSLCAPVPALRQVLMLKILAESRPAKDSASGRLFARLLESFAQTAEFFEKVLPEIDLPTQDGNWHPSRDVAQSASGVARRHRLLSELRTGLRLDSDPPGREHTVEDYQINSRTTDLLAKYFESWSELLPRDAVGAFLGLLGNGPGHSIAQLAEDWLGDNVSLEVVRNGLLPEETEDYWDRIRVFSDGSVAQGRRVNALNVLGELIEVDIDENHKNIFSIDPVPVSAFLGNYWEIRFRDIEPQYRTAHELVALLRGAVEWWAVRVLRVNPQAVHIWWSRWGSGSQAQVSPVRASILAHLPLTLHQLGVRDRPALHKALVKAQRAQRKREQALPDQFKRASKAEKKALGKLASRVSMDKHRNFIWKRVQALISRYGYRADSILLELTQNADDALAQAAEIAKGELAPAVRKILIRVHDVDGTPTVDIRHYGRPINDTGGAAFPQGQEREWDQDLYFMMLLNLSGKPGEKPGQTTAAATTGRFGLGFKSVHLVSSKPEVVSGFISFAIDAGLLPSERKYPDDPDLLPVEGHRATRVRLPLRSDRNADELLQEMFQRFVYARVLLPVFSRQLREIIVEGGLFPGISRFNGVIIPGAPHWLVAREVTELPNHEQFRLVRFQPNCDAGSTVALVFGLQDGLPTPFPAELPFLWNVTPTSEGWACGYAINGPFKLDPGRTHVSLDDEVTVTVVNMLGKELGAGLIELHDALEASSGAPLVGLPDAEQLPSFITKLWTILATGMGSSDGMRKQFFSYLHGPERGVSAWMSERSVVPSGLPTPFSQRLPSLKSETPIEEAVADLDHPDVCKAFEDINEIVDLLETRCVVSGHVVQRLRPFISRPISQLRPASLLEELTHSWNQFLSPERLRSLQPLADDEVWRRLVPNQQVPRWSMQLEALAEDGSRNSLKLLLVPQKLPFSDAGSEFRDEMFRAAFAPDSSILDQRYVKEPEDMKVFQHLRVRHDIGTEKMTHWLTELDPKRYQGGLYYLLHGSLQREILEQLMNDHELPEWLGEYEAVRGMLEEMEEEDWLCERLLATLFPGRHQHWSELGPQAQLPSLVQSTFFDRLRQWWDDEETRHLVITKNEEKAWPGWLRQTSIGDELRSDSDDHWLALLILGASRSLGRAKAEQHRAFLELVYQEGWWEILKTPDEAAAWMELLRTWQDRAVQDRSYSRWMSLFPDMYQLSRYLEIYRRLLKTAGRRPKDAYRVSSLLAPRVDEALTGAGQNFDAPPAPLNIGLHWILRELVRLGVLDGDHLLKDCWVPSEQVLGFLRPLGLEISDAEMSNAAKAKEVFEFLAKALDTETPHLHRAFDIPLRYIDRDQDLRRQFGLED